MSSGKGETIVLKRFPVGPLETNCYLAVDSSSNKGVLIDPGFPAPEIKEHIRDRGIEVTGIINTHGHADHIGGNHFFGYPVMIHELDAPFLSDPFKNLSFSANVSVRYVAPRRILREGDTVDAGGIRFEVLHTPGHSPGGISLVYDGYLFSGDTLFFEGVGRTDLPGGDRGQLETSIRAKLFTLPDTVKVFPGHGPATTIGHEKQHNPFL